MSKKLSQTEHKMADQRVLNNQSYCVTWQLVMCNNYT